MKKLKLTLVLVLWIMGSMVFANNIMVSNTSIVSQDMSAGPNHASNFSMVQFDLSWENSWRVNTGPSNWDAAWVFVKFRVGASNPTFTGVNSSGTTVTVSSTANLRVGMPVRVSSGTGTFAANTVISSITNATQFVVSSLPTVTLNNATIECIRIWEHARLNGTGHTAAVGSIIDVSADGIGAFIYRNSNGFGNNNFTNTRLRWNYGTNDVADDAVITVQVFAIEMVYVPQGSFFVGSGGLENGSFTDGSISTATATASISGGVVSAISLAYAGSGYSSATVTFSGGGGTGAAASATISGGVITGFTITNPGSGYTSAPTVFISAPNTVPFQITSEAALGIDNAAGKLWGTSSSGSNSIGNDPGDAEATLAASFPKGFAAFYCMKYEISQGQYRDFLNTLTHIQQTRRIVNTAVGNYMGINTTSTTPQNRNGIRLISDPGGSSPRV